MDLKIHLDLIESRLRQVIETWIVPFNRGDFQHRLAHAVVEAMREKIFLSENGQPVAPHRFTIRLNPVLIRELQGSSVLENLPEALRQAGQSAGVLFMASPDLRLEPAAHFTLDEISVVAQNIHLSPGNTAALRLPAETGRAEPRANIGTAFLILNDDQIFPLVQPIINLGRRPDNHLVIDDPRISRVHAQIRFNRGLYILFDLNSTGGTSVNGLRIRQHALKPGDVISLAGITLIYGEEPNPGENHTDTTQVIITPPPPPEELR